jgi:pyruvate/2-oxoglutarate dehydrogenase complex dihydrolipoamide acyltransferase (E2) component
MASTFSAAQSEFSSDRALPGGMMLNRPSLIRRAARRVTRFVIVLCVGVATTLAWQSYGDVARAMIANSFPQLGWLAPEAAPATQTAPDMAASAAPAAPAAPSADVQQLKEQLKELSLGLDAVRRSVDQFAAQVAAGQRLMAGDIAKLQAEISPPQQRAAAAPAAAPARKPAPPAPAMPLSLTQPLPPPVR